MLFYDLSNDGLDNEQLTLFSGFFLEKLKLDSFRLNVSFDFEAHPDSYGVPGSEFTAVDITQLTVNAGVVSLVDTSAKVTTGATRSTIKPSVPSSTSPVPQSLVNHLFAFDINVRD